jgi:O-antigen/teichoic acid export membrane protein
VGFGKKLISNTTFLLIDWFLVTALSFLFWLIIGKLLSKQDVGIITTSINTAIILSSISFFGLSPTILKLIPEYVQRRQQKLSIALVKFAGKVLLVANISIVAVFTIFSTQIASLLKVLPIHVALIGIGTLAMSLSDFSTVVLRGFQKMIKIAVTDTIGYSIKVALTFILLFAFMNNIMPLIVFSVSYLAIFLLRMKTSWFLSKGDKLNYREIISSYAFPSFISSIAWLVFTNAQYVILTFIQDPATTGVFAIASIVTTLIAVIPVTLSSAFFPILSQLSVNSSFKKNREYLFSNVLRYAFFISIPLALLFALFPTKIIILFSRAEFLDAKYLFPILSLAAILNGIGILFLNNLYALKKVKQNRNIVIATAIIFLSLAIILTKMFSAFGLSVAYTSSMFFMFFASLYYLRKIATIKIPVFNILKIIFAVLLWLIVFSFVSNLTSNNILELILLIISALIYPIILLPLKFYKKEDIKILEYVKKHVPSFGKPLVDILIKIISKFS